MVFKKTQNLKNRSLRNLKSTKPFKYKNSKNIGSDGMVNQSKTVILLLGMTNKYTRQVEIPRTITDFWKDMRSIRVLEDAGKHEQQHNALRFIDSITNSVIDNFNEEAAKSLNNTLNILETTSDGDNEFDKAIAYALQQYKYLNNKIVEVDDTFWSKEKYPMQFLVRSLIYKTTLLSTNTISNFSENYDKNEIKSKLKELRDVDSNSRELELARLGFFLGLEPLFIISLLEAYAHQEREFIVKYEALLNRFYYFGLNVYSKTYIETVKKDRKEPDYDSYDKFVKVLESNPI